MLTIALYQDPKRRLLQEELNADQKHLRAVSSMCYSQYFQGIWHADLQVLVATVANRHPSQLQEGADTAAFCGE